MLRKYLDFLQRVSLNIYGKIGVALTTSSFVSYLLFEIFKQVGLIENAYFGLITYMVLPLVFFIGLAFIPIGWFVFKKERKLSTVDLIEFRFEAGTVSLLKGILNSKLILASALLTLMNVLFITILGMESLKFMDTSEFCGTACHSVMAPEWIAYQNSPHARVKCVDCHIGDSAESKVAAKLNGMRQMILAMSSNFNRPIPTPVHTLSPSNETCEKCHWPEKFFSDRIKEIVKFADDEENTPMYTTLLLKVNSKAEGNSMGLHWHVKDENAMTFTSVDDKHQQILTVDVLQSDGSYKRYANEELEDQVSPENIEKHFDCIDCHNRATHIYEDANEAVDLRLLRNEISISIPYIKREGLVAIEGDYPDKATALAEIESSIRTFYTENYKEFTDANPELISAAIASLQNIYDINIYPDMNIVFGTYPTHLGHQDDTGCLRCHNSSLVDSEGNTIPEDCETCHIILQEEESEAFDILGGN